jgi:hypothetical protein
MLQELRRPENLDAETLEELDQILENLRQLTSNQGNGQ